MFQVVLVLVASPNGRDAQYRARGKQDETVCVGAVTAVRDPWLGVLSAAD